MKIIVAFDLHEVILHRSYPDFLKALHTFLKRDFLHHITLANPRFAYRLYSILKKHPRTAEHVYEKLVEHYPKLAHSRQQFYALCNAYRIDPQMRQLVTDIQKSGNQVAICSNIGSTVFELYRAQHVEFFTPFAVITTSHPERNYIRKPDKEFFEQFKDACRRHYGSGNTLIFIDDRENVAAARACGLHSILFKSPRQVRKDLYAEINK